MAKRKVSCDLRLDQPADATHEGCVIRTKRGHISISRGQCGVAQWQIRWPNGDTADFSDCDIPGSVSEASVSESVEVSDVSVEVGFKSCDGPCLHANVVATIVDASEGLVEFQIPDEVCHYPGIYQFEIGVLIGSSLAMSDKGLISVESGVFGTEGTCIGPPSIQEIRMHLRDRPEENDLLQDVEFDDAEILAAVVRPVQQFNERPPTLRYYSCRTFPFRYNWLNAIVSELLRTAAHHYVRNKMNAQGAGLSVDDKDKDDDYLRIAKMYRDEWVEFMALKKAELNLRGFYGSTTNRW